MRATGPQAHSTQRQVIEQRILRAAEAAFAHNGFKGTSMESVAEAAGLSKQNMLYYFRSKRLLYRRVLENILDQWVEKMVFTENPDSQPTEVIAQYIRGKLELSRDYPEGSRVFAHEIINGAPMLKDYLSKRLKPQFEHDLKLVKRWQQAGLIDEVDPAHLFFTIWAATQTYADFSSQIQLLLGHEPLADEGFEQACSTLTHIVLKGLGLSPAA
ncbi:TetR family transcriptional regulator [Terasakiispira papahanaumokuakeensis]|uniref:TetR family transcriptional regulator n=1 Tax=Terasakiispira papahanaumokuakeensis TaxID=197479 RepID=A0A1E2VFL0_9GAMM|nr:TetR/AcrR family transcriptional regulator [Terasakiispira papahanaumokuakeensis]ODC05445.1 TetR family transcriptional regulator [Terasakiispira papahanaumokuakeensis]